MLFESVKNRTIMFKLQQSILFLNEHSFFYTKTIIYLYGRLTIELTVFFFSLVYERALRGYLNNRNSVHFQPEVHGFFFYTEKNT